MVFKSRPCYAVQTGFELSIFLSQALVLGLQVHVTKLDSTLQSSKQTYYAQGGSAREKLHASLDQGRLEKGQKHRNKGDFK